MISPGGRLLALAALSSVVATAACRSPHVEITVDNQTGASVQLLEVKYPSASFGTGSLAPGAVFHYQIQVQGSGPVSLVYTAPDGAQPSITGPELADRARGSLVIVLLPGGKAEYHFNPDEHESK
jgi:hypothetical protein